SSSTTCGSSGAWQTASSCSAPAPSSRKAPPPRSPRAASSRRRISGPRDCRLPVVRRLAILLAGVAVLAAGCGGSSPRRSPKNPVIAVDVPVTGSPYIAQTIRQGVELATSNYNGGGGVRVGNQSYLLKVKLYDNHGSARQAVEDTRRALDAGAVTIVTDGTGVDATWQPAKQKGTSVTITYDGGSGLRAPQRARERVR